MANRQAFGRRINAETLQRPASVRSEPVAQNIVAPLGGISEEKPSPASTQAELPSVGRELQDWKRARNGGFTVPWRQLSLMATLCFGIASFVLPDSVNDNVQWPLYALMAASAYAGFSKRRKRAAS